MKRWLLLRRTEPVCDESSPPVGAAVTSDEELLRQFVIHRDDRAFAELVGRYGDMVMGVCRRVLGMQHDAEDAFQAVFLVLARKADSLRRGGSLGAWLHKTAFRTALRARSVRGRRREQAAEDIEMIAVEPLAEIATGHDRSVVDEELNALPERYRLPLYLCCVEGKPLDVAARQLGWSVGSVKGRLERGRAELRRRLLMRRVPFALGVAAIAALAPTTAQASTIVAPSLLVSTVQAGMQYAVGQSALGYVSQNALSLAQGSWKIMSLTTTKIVACSVAMVGIAVVGGSRLSSPAAAGGSGGSGIVLEASFAPAGGFDFDTRIALADEREGAKAGPRDGERPRTGPRDGETPRIGAREGDQPRTGAREGDQPRREGEGERRPEARDGERRPEGGERPAVRNPLEGFKPQTAREELLFKMVVQLQAEMAALRRMVEVRGNPARDGAGRPGEAVRREGDAPRREGEVRKDGDAPRREGEVRKDGDASRREGEVRKDGDAPKREGEVRKDGDAPRREGEIRKDGDAPKREGGDAPKKDGE